MVKKEEKGSNGNFKKDEASRSTDTLKKKTGTWNVEFTVPWKFNIYEVRSKH